jgi:hypothetical protein
VKRLIGWVFAISGGLAAAWGAMCMMTGSMQDRLDLTPELSLNAMTTGLAGLAVLTIGLVWVRD